MDLNRLLGLLAAPFASLFLVLSALRFRGTNAGFDRRSHSDGENSSQS
jgi:hypothetical protein